MKTQATPKQRGRPRLDASLLSRERILSTAGQLMAAGASDVSMRAVASALGVNAMALYHYFSDKEALRYALVEQAFAPLFAIRPRMAKLPNPELRLQLLAKKYMLCAAKALPLTRNLAVRGGTPLATKFSELFDEALGNPTPASGHAALHDVLVDYLNGVALAGPRRAAKALDAGWPVLMAGVRQHLEQGTATEGEHCK
jgi:AcrR family transcriptional regulator